MSDSIKRYYRKRVNFFSLLDKIKLWPSTNGILHGIKTFTVKGDYAEVITHCGEKFIIKNSKNSRAARWMRNKWYRGICDKCGIPEWKIKKYSTTSFTQHYGKDLKEHENHCETSYKNVD